MNKTTQIHTEAFEVEDDAGNRSIIVQTEPVTTDDETGAEQTVRLGAELRLRNGETVMPLSDTEFETAHGKRWRKVE